LVEYTNNEQVPPELKELYKKNIDDYVKSTSFYFKEDSVLYSIQKMDTAKGKWSVDKNLTSLEMYDDLQNSKAKVDIISVDDKTLKLRSKNENFEVNMKLEKVNK
jgi:hypothetical protein